ncbi:XdhC/CoxI family protein [uncultured Intestinimonas sp.]|uniref:XdhC family protein n=1 Tax=uncultured Intestinimonas sp. TaxID=1689265 RepID=UPI0025FC0218|nr:XdhC/CoxI family protein [uncultured Intestinimonas sp.]
MEELLREAVHRLAQGRSLALAGVAERTGSAPRGPGALLLAEPGGPTLGTVGGGLLEARVRELALEQLSRGGGGPVSFSMEHDGLIPRDRQSADVTLWLQALRAGDDVLLTALEEAADRLATRALGCLLWESSGPPRLLARRPEGASGAAGLFPGPHGEPAFWLELRRPCHVFLYGAGHVAVETASLLARMGFACTVLDDRPDFARAERFPGAEEVRCRDLEYLSPDDLPGPEDCALLMSRSHSLDLILLRAILPAEPAFLGVLGSRKKGAFLRSALAAEGFSQADLDRIVLPVGLPLGGETPAEIALSVAAQLVQLRASGALSPTLSKKSEKNC